MYPKLDTITHWNLTAMSNNGSVEHNVYAQFIAVDHDCISPKVTIHYLEADYGQNDQYFTVYANDSTSIAQCSSEYCSLGTALCLNSYSLETDIEVSGVYIFRFAISAAVRSFYACGAFSLYATVEIRCGLQSYVYHMHGNCE